MIRRKLLLIIIIWALIQLPLIACSNQQPANTPVPPSPTTIPPTATARPPRPFLCEDIEGSCLEFRFEMYSCHRIGPETLPAGEITLIYSNYTDQRGAVDLEKLDEDKTYQDMLTYMRGLGAFSGMQPEWSVDVTGGSMDPGEFIINPKELGAGTYIAVCWQTKPPHDIFLADGGLVIKDQQ